MTKFEELAEKYCDYKDSGDYYTFTLDQLDAYFSERLKMVAGEPVGFLYPPCDVSSVPLVYSAEEMKADEEPLDGYTPLYKLEGLDK